MYFIGQRRMLSTILSGVFIVGPILGYIPQYDQMRNTGVTEGFSTLVCFILIISNMLRISFWFMKGFKMALLWQSVVMLMAQLLLLEVIVRKRRNHIVLRSEDEEITLNNNNSDTNTNTSQDNCSDRNVPIDVENVPLVEDKYKIMFTFHDFWNWRNFSQYMTFILSATAAVVLITLGNIKMIRSSIITEAIGTMALFIEATLAMPQVYANWCNKSSDGLRYIYCKYTCI